MKRLQGLFFGVLCSAMLFGLANTSEACTAYGKVVYSSQSSTGATTVYIAPLTALPSFYYVFQLTANSLGTQALVNKLNTAQSADQTVYVSSTSTSCPTSGTTRYYGIASQVNVYTLY